MIKPVGLVSGHYECRFLKETVPVLEHFLAFELVKEEEGEATLKHPNTNWLLVVHEAGYARQAVYTKVERAILELPEAVPRTVKCLET